MLVELLADGGEAHHVGEADGERVVPGGRVGPEVELALGGGGQVTPPGVLHQALDGRKHGRSDSGDGLGDLLLAGVRVAQRLFDAGPEGRHIGISHPGQ